MEYVEFNDGYYYPKFFNEGMKVAYIVSYEPPIAYICTVINACGNHAYIECKTKNFKRLVHLNEVCLVPKYTYHTDDGSTIHITPKPIIKEEVMCDKCNLQMARMTDNSYKCIWCFSTK